MSHHAPYLVIGLINSIVDICATLSIPPPRYNALFYDKFVSRITRRAVHCARPGSFLLRKKFLLRVVFIDLMLQLTFFLIELLLLRAGYVSAVGGSVSLLLGAD